MRDVCECGTQRNEDGACPACEADRAASLADYRRTGYHPAGPWRSREGLIRDAGANDA